MYVNQQPRQVRIGVELPPNSTMDDLRTALHNDTGIDRDHIILAEINENGQYSYLSIIYSYIQLAKLVNVHIHI